MGAGTDFLTSVFGAELPGQTRIQLWSLKTKKSTYLASARAADPVITSLGSTDLYVAAGLAPHQLPPNKRCEASAISGCGALWMDVDVNGGPDAKQGAAPTLDAAIELCSTITPPSVVVLTGGGCQPWWIFDELTKFRSDAERQAFGQLVHRWQGAHRHSANSDGWTIDATHDLARLMRLPGTINGKGGESRPVELAEPDQGLRFALDDLVRLVTDRHVASSTLTPTAVRRTESGLTVADGAQPPMVLFEALRMNSELFDRTWKHSRRDNGTAAWSLSEYDLSLASQAAAAGWSDQQLADLLVCHRNQHDPAGSKQLRLDYLERTIARARATIRQEASEQDRLEAIREIETIDHSGEGADQATTFELFNRIIASGVVDAPEVIRLRQYGTSGELARLVLTVRHHEQDRDVILGDINGLLTQNRFNATLAVETGHVSTVVRQANWTSAVRVLLRQRELMVDEEDTREGDLAELIRLYLERKGVPKRSDDALAERLPFTEQGRIYLHVRSFHRFVSMSVPSPPTKSDLLMGMRSIDFERTTLAYSIDDRRTSVSYYWTLSRNLAPSLNALNPALDLGL